MTRNASKFSVLTAGLLVVGLGLWLASEAEALSRSKGGLASRSRMRRSNHQSMMHNHLSRKVFDRACAASKDSIDEIIACLTHNETLVKALKENTAQNCYKEAFGTDFDPKDVHKHKELICNNREKFEVLTTCIYKSSSALMDPKQLEKFTETLVDVGLCIINALDG